MKKKVLEATVEELIADISYWEDADQVLTISHDGQGTFYVQSVSELRSGGCGDDLQCALIAYGKTYWEGRFEQSKLDWHDIL